MVDMRLVVVMTTCDGGDYVARQLDSIAGQDRPPTVLVVNDDASVDGTPEVVEAFARRVSFPVLTMTRSERVGLQRNAEDALRRGLPLGEVMVLADQDDLWHPHKLTAIADAFESDDHVAMWFSDATLIGPDDSPIGQTLWDMVNIGTVWVDDVLSGDGLRRLVHGQTLTGPTMALHRRVVEKALPLPPMRHGDELLFHPDGWLAALGRLSGSVRVDSAQLTLYRRHPAQMTSALPPSPQAGRKPGPTRWRDLRRESARARLLADRVRAHSTGWDAANRAELLALDEFLTARSGGAGSADRLNAIVAQARAGSYGRFANGSRTILMDLACLARPSLRREHSR